MKLLLLVLSAVIFSNDSYANSTDCSKFDKEISFRDKQNDPSDGEAITDVNKGLISGSVRIQYGSPRCYLVGQVLDVTNSLDAQDSTGKRPSLGKVKVTRVDVNVPWEKLTDQMAKNQKLASAAELRKFLVSIYGKIKGADGKEVAVDLTKELFTNVQFTHKL